MAATHEMCCAGGFVRIVPGGCFENFCFSLTRVYLFINTRGGGEGRGVCGEKKKFPRPPLKYKIPAATVCSMLAPIYDQFRVFV